MPLSQTRIQERLKEKFGDRSSRTGGKGAVRRKYKAPAKTATQDDKRLNSQLKRLNVTQIPAIEEVNLFKDDGTVVHFTKPKVQAEIASNTYVIQGDHATKKLEELFPDILPQLGGESIEKLKNLAQVLQKANFGADQVPNLVDENFEEVAKRDEKEETAEKSGDKPAVQNTEEKKKYQWYRMMLETLPLVLLLQQLILMQHPLLQMQIPPILTQIKKKSPLPQRRNQNQKHLNPTQIKPKLCKCKRWGNLNN